MPSYAPNFTGRLRVRYHAALANHSQTWRFPFYGTLGIGMAAAKDAVADYYAEMAGILYDDFSIISVSYAIENTDIFLPTAPFVVIGAIALPVDDPGVKARATSFVGRSSGGQPAKIFQYGVAPADDTLDDTAKDFRLISGEVANIDAAVTALNSFTAGLTLCANDGLGVTWYSYANVKDHDYWVKRVRQGG